MIGGRTLRQRTSATQTEFTRRRHRRTTSSSVARTEPRTRRASTAGTERLYSLVVDVPDRVVRRLHATHAGRWSLPAGAFADALRASADKAFAGRSPAERELERYLERLHLADLALACACIHGVDAAWEQLMRDQRPGLYRAADAIDATGGARDLADALWADLFSGLLRYFHGRSSLGTWLRAVLAQRHVDAVRASRRLAPLPAEDLLPSAPPAAEPGTSRCHQLVQRAFEATLAQLDARDRLRLACYHAQQLTLAETGRVLREHEATVSRRLTHTRRTLRERIERWLERDGALPSAEARRCLELVVEDPGPLDVASMLGAPGERKIPGVDRSKRGAV